MQLPKLISHAAIVVSSCCAILFVALSLVLIGFLSSDKPQRHNGSQFQPSPEDLPSKAAPVPLEPIWVPIPTTDQRHETIQQALARCDTEAAENSGSLYFQLTPVSPLNFESATLLFPPGDRRGSFYLMQSELVLSGLQDISLEVSSRPYKVSVLDSRTGQVHKWETITGSAQFTLPNAAELGKFRIGLQFENDEVTWTGAYGHDPGSCYRVNIFLPRQFYSPLGSQFEPTVLKSFPSPAETLRCANHVCEREPR